MRFDYSISEIRVSAMLMIVLFHCLAYNCGGWPEFGNSILYGNFVVACNRNLSFVGLNAFVFISGLLYFRINKEGKYASTCLFINKKAKRLLVPYCFWGLILCIVFHGHENPIDLLYGISHLWFLMMLFNIFVFIEITKKIWSKTNLQSDLFNIFFFLSISYCSAKFGVIPKGNDGSYILTLQQALDYLPFFYIGMMTDKYKVYKYVHINNKYFVSLVIVLLFIVGTIFFMVHFPLGKFYQLIPTLIMLLIVYSLLYNRQNHVNLTGETVRELQRS